MPPSRRPATFRSALTTPLTRARLLRLALAGAAVVLAGPAAAGRSLMPALSRLSVRNRGRGYAGDRSFFATVSPGVAGRDTAKVSFSLDRPARVRLEAVRTALRKRTVVWEAEKRLPAGGHSLAWTPELETPVGSYVMRLTVESAQGRRRVYGGTRPSRPELARAPVVRVLGVEASFDRRSYAVGETPRLTIAADAAALSIQLLACGTEDGYTDRADEMRGLPVGDLARDRLAELAIRTADGSAPDRRTREQRLRGAHRHGGRARRIRAADPPPGDARHCRGRQS